MSLELTLALLALSLAIAAFAGWRGARPPNFHKGPRMIPWRWIMLFAAATAMLLLIHVFGAMRGGG
jgi:hypothetical protein